MPFNKPVRLLSLIFVLYTIVVALYLFNLPRPIPVPGSWIGTPADPATFMSAAELQDNAFYARLRDFLYFMEAPFEWLLLLIGLFRGWFFYWKRWLDRRLKWRLLSGVAFVALLLAFLELVELPFSVASYALSRAYGISNMNVSFWLTDHLKSFFVSTAITLPILLVLFLLIRNSAKRWWLWAGLLVVPLILFSTFIQPVLLDPLFNDYELLKESELKRDILALAAKADIPADRVYEVNMSRRTNALNAYVTGIGTNTRIVLWDTMLNQMSKDEILFTMAHEMGHYKMKHVWWGTWLAIAGAFVTLFILFVVSKWAIRYFGWMWGFESPARLLALPLLIAILSVTSFVSTPFVSGISRIMESAADEYALHIVEQPQAGVSGFQELARTGRSETYPPAFIKWWRYTHPPLSERLYRFVEASALSPHKP